MQLKFDVVVVEYGSKAYEKSLSTSTASTFPKTRITCIDNRSPCRLDLYGWINRAVRCGENVGWLKGANIGLAMSTAPYVVLMNDDCEIVTENWLEKMADVFEKGDRIACVGPKGNGGLQAEVDETLILSPQLSLDGYGIGWVPLSFFCVMFKREALTDVGYLDERFSPGYGEDDDWQARAHLKGWKMAITAEVSATHSSSGYDGQRGELQKRNVLLLKEKYAKILRSPELVEVV